MLTGYLTWMPTYLYERFDMDLAAAGFHSMFYTHLFAFVGILIAGRISDRIAAKHPASRMAMQGIGLLAAVPFIVMMGHSSTLWIIYLGFAGFGFARHSSTPTPTRFFTTSFPNATTPRRPA